jgi:hypothetical protein
MIDDMAGLKKAMEQMDAEDPIVAQAAKDRAAQTLSDARLSFSKMADLIEQRRLLLRPRKPPLGQRLAGFSFYLFTPVVGVVSGVCVPPDFGMTVSFIFVGGMLG